MAEEVGAPRPAAPGAAIPGLQSRGGAAAGPRVRHGRPGGAGGLGIVARPVRAPRRRQRPQRPRHHAPDAMPRPRRSRTPGGSPGPLGTA
jgi:hypothetical protein